MKILEVFTNYIRFRTVKDIKSYANRYVFKHSGYTEYVIKDILNNQKDIIKQMKATRCIVLATAIEDKVTLFLVPSDGENFINLVKAANKLKEIGIYPITIKENSDGHKLVSLFTSIESDYDIDNIKVNKIKTTRSMALKNESISAVF